MNKEDFKALILRSFSSPEEYKINSPSVRKELANQNKETIKIYLDTTLGLLADKKATSVARFQALYSLKANTERPNDKLNELLFSNASAMKLFQEQASVDKDKAFPERGSKLLSSKPNDDDDKKLGTNYLALLLEMIKFWDMNYGATDRGKDNPQRALFKKLSVNIKVPFPEKFYYYNSSEQTASDKQNENEDVSKMTNVNANNPSKDAREKLDVLNQLELKLGELYNKNKDESEVDRQVLKQYYDAIALTYKQISGALELVLRNPASNEEMLIDQIMKQNELIGSIVPEYQKYAAGGVEWKMHRAAILANLTSELARGVLVNSDPATKLLMEARKLKAVNVGRTNASNLMNDTDKEIEEVRDQPLVKKYTAPLEEEKIIENTRGKVTAVNLEKLKKSEAGSSPQDLISDSNQMPVQIKSNNNGKASDLDGDKYKANIQQEQKSVIQAENLKVEEDKVENKAVGDEVIVHEYTSGERSMRSSQSSQNELRQHRRSVDIGESTTKNQNLSQQRRNSQFVSQQDLKLSKNENTPLQSKPTTASNKTESPVLKEHNGAIRTAAKLSQIFNFSSPSSNKKYSSELKMMESSIRMATDRYNEMDKIKRGIQQSFSTKRLKSPTYRDILDQGLLKSIETQIAQIKNEKLSSTIELQRSNIPSSPGRQDRANKKASEESESTLKASRELEIMQQTLSLQKQCEEYMKEADRMKRENSQLKIDLKQAQTNILSPNSQSFSSDEIKDLILSNRTLLDKVKTLEEQLKEIQQPANKASNRSTYSSKEIENQNAASSELNYNETVNSRSQSSQGGLKSMGSNDSIQANRRMSQSSTRKKLEIITQLDNEEHHLEGSRSQESARSDLIISSKYENFNGKDCLIHEMVINSPARTRSSRLGFVSPSSRQASLMDSGNYSHHRGNKSPRDNKFMNSPGLANRDENQNQKLSGVYYNESTFESDIEQDVESIRGKQIISEHYLLKELIPRLDFGEQSLQQFKTACLKAKSLLFENEYFQVGLTTGLVQDYASAKNVLNLMVFYGNKLKEDITDFKVFLTEGLNLNVAMKPEHYESVILGQKQLKQEFWISLTGVPFNCLQLNCSGQVQGKRVNFTMPLPNLLIKFMGFKHIDHSEFKARWKKLENSIVKTEPIALSNKLIKKASDFKSYFSNLIELGATSDLEGTPRSVGIVYGGLFELDALNTDYLIRLNVLSTNEMVFQIATKSECQQLAAYLLQTLVFIFRR